ncbi:MAG TPA: sigma 54-interacting transcriptional regulator [Acidobacteriota bacterium]|nr:sigma 54-interacting transcriptional regulator [Acidobacteriota bacterium]
MEKCRTQDYGEKPDIKREVEAHDREIILNSINEGVFTVDLSWRITSFNRAAERITGVLREDAIGRPCCDVFHANICETNCALRRTFATGVPVVKATAHIVNNQGRQVPISISAALLKNTQGEVVGGVETFQDLSQVEQLRKELESRYTFSDIIGRSAVMIRLFEILPQIANSSSTVLIEGASGTGKELFARAIHNLSPRRKKPFVAVNCAALPDTLLESELFGHKAGAFTDARRDKPGRFQLAEGGTIFLDEIGDISPAMQIRLLRVLQERVVEPLGSIKPIPVNVRVIAATNKDLARLVRTGKFRDDLYYRVRVVHLKLPELRQRREDIPLLVDHLIVKFNHLLGKDITGVSAEVMTRLMEHDYPGNVRELENIIEQAFVLCRGEMIELQHLPPELRPERTIGQEEATRGLTLQAMERLMISETLRRCRGNRKLAARELGINASTLYRKIKSLAIQVPEGDGRRRNKQATVEQV